jgi:hypothetical protein
MARRKHPRVQAQAMAVMVTPDIESQSAKNEEHKRQWPADLAGLCRCCLRFVHGQIGCRFRFLAAAVRERAIRARLQNKSLGLRVSQRLNLGEKRYVAVLQCDGERFLVGGGAGSVVMLARLKSEEGDKHSFAEVLHRVDTEHMTIQ